MTRNFKEMLEAKWAEGKFVCVGLDSKESELPLYDDEPMGQYSFNTDIIDATKDTAACYKPNLAFYPGSEGKKRLRSTIAYGHEVAPDIPWIIDVKDGDIGNTNIGYVEDAFEYFRADACTVHNYMGMEAMKPFLDRKYKGIFVLCKTSNPGSGEFQNLEVTVTEEMFVELSMGFPIEGAEKKIVPKHLPLYQWVAWRVSNGRGWNYNRNCGLVVGATYPDELEQVRTAAPHVPILCPGIGKQGGDLQATVRAARDSGGRGFLINSSSGIIFASKGPDFAEAARREVLKLDLAIRNELTALT